VHHEQLAIRCLVLRTNSPRAVLTIVCIAELMAMSLWFSGTVVAPFLANPWPNPSNAVSSLTLAVQLGFVAGAIFIAVFNLNDHFSAAQVITWSAWLAAAANYGSFIHHDSPAMALALRFVVGAALAGVYPSGMKLLASWFDHGRGAALGTLVGSLAIGSALPHLIAAIGAVTGNNWHLVMRASTLLAMVGGLLILIFVEDGPFAAKSPPFDLHQVTAVLRNRRLRLATFGYLGHMWELYSLWTWIAAVLAVSFATDPRDPHVRLWSFIAMAVGLIGCVWAGVAADRAERAHLVRSRSKVTIIAMVASGACCLLAAAFLPQPHVVTVIALIWGISVVADSAQFSAIVSEVADRRYMGTALTMQTALGFLLTAFAIRATGYLAQHYGWRIAVASLSIGPILGTLAMQRLSNTAE
jgi:MFS family permease